MRNGRAERESYELRNTARTMTEIGLIYRALARLFEGYNRADGKLFTRALCTRGGRASKSDSVPPRGDAWILAFGLARAE